MAKNAPLGEKQHPSEIISDKIIYANIFIDFQIPTKSRLPWILLESTYNPTFHFDIICIQFVIEGADLSDMPFSHIDLA